MKRYLLYVLLLLAAPVLTPRAYSEPSAEELEQNRRKLGEWRKRPEQFQHLRNEADAFFGLGEEQQRKIMRLDHELQQQTPAQQARLTTVMDRYVEWFDKLDEKDRRRIRETKDRTVRLALVKELRDQEWLKTQPKAVREQATKLEGAARTGYVTKLRLEERQHRLEWLVAARFWKELEKGTTLPARLGDFTGDVVTYVTEYLRPMLSKEEEERLDKAQGQWPQYPMTLVELADRHPPALPGPKGPKSFTELPSDVKSKFKSKGGSGPPKLLKIEKTWPGFAINLAAYAKDRKITLPHELWPWDITCLSPPMQEFVKKRLTPLLDNKESLRLYHASSTKWPEYPETIQELAGKYNLQVPWQTLPGPRERWDNYRLRTTAVRGN